MSKSIFDITHEHGQQMYILGLQYAIEILEIGSDDTLEILKEKLAEEKKLNGGL